MNIGIDARPALKAKTGVGTYVINLIRYLTALDRVNHYHLFSNSLRDRFRPPWSGDRPLCRVRDYRFPNVMMNYVWDRLGGPWIRPLLRGLDVFHFTGAVAPRLRGMATVATVYDLHHVRCPGAVDPRHRVSRERLRDNLQRVSRIIAISEFTRSDLIGLLDIPAERIDVIPLGVEARGKSSNQNLKLPRGEAKLAPHGVVDPALFQPPDPEKRKRFLKDRYRLEGDYLLFVGTLEERKNLRRLVEAFAEVRERHRDLQLVLAGAPGWGYSRIREKIHDLGLDEAVRLPGYLLEDGDLNFLYAGASAFVFPSIYEGFGLPLLEAFACGTPVAASSGTAIPEVAGGAALLFDPERPGDIAEKILRILEDSTLSEDLREKGWRRAAAFRWEETAIKTLAVYHRIGEKP